MRSSPSSLLRDARRSAGLSQASLAARLGTTQSAVARLETEGANPRTDTLARALAACGRELQLVARPRRPNIDDTQVVERLRLSPGDRIKAFERSYANLRELAIAGARGRGELA
jgi:transcriptional regulator with XRE-family HTH domain